jgi:hypothetical protein
MAGMLAMQEQLPAMPWMAGMLAMQEQLPAMPWMAGMLAMQEQLPAMVMDGRYAGAPVLPAAMQEQLPALHSVFTRRRMKYVAATSGLVLRAHLRNAARICLVRSYQEAYCICDLGSRQNA